MLQARALHELMFSSWHPVGVGDNKKTVNHLSQVTNEDNLQRDKQARVLIQH